MTTITITSRIKSAEAAEHDFDLSTFNECPEHHRKPNITLVKWGNRSHQKEFVARCPLCSKDKAVFGGLSNDPQQNRWNKFNERPIDRTLADAHRFKGLDCKGGQID